MKLGFSHPVIVPVPEHVKAEVPYPTKIALTCTDKHQLGLFAAKVRKWRPPEPYKGKVGGFVVLRLKPTDIIRRVFSSVTRLLE